MPSTNTNTGTTDSMGRTIWRGPRGGLFVRVGGKKRPPARGGRPRTTLANLPPNVHDVIGALLSDANVARLAATGRVGRDAMRGTSAARKAVWDDLAARLKAAFDGAFRAEDYVFRHKNNVGSLPEFVPGTSFKVIGQLAAPQFTAMHAKLDEPINIWAEKYDVVFQAHWHGSSVGNIGFYTAGVYLIKKSNPYHPHTLDIARSFSSFEPIARDSTWRVQHIDPRRDLDPRTRKLLQRVVREMGVQGGGRG